MSQSAAADDAFSPPPPPFGRALLFGGLAAFAGAAAWAALIHFAHLEHGLLAWGIGGLVGAAVLWAGGHGKPLAVCAGVLALLSIGTGKQLAFRHGLDTAVADTAAELTPEYHQNFAKAAADWVALGEAPTDEQVQKFLADLGGSAQTAAEFAAETGPKLRQFHSQQPTLDQWRLQVGDEMRAEASFVDYLREDFHVLDLLFVFLGLSTAYGMVAKATELRLAAARQARAAAAEAPVDDASRPAN